MKSPTTTTHDSTSKSPTSTGSTSGRPNSNTRNRRTPFPNLTLIWLPDDHTGGAPDPVAQVADNDLAIGRIVETISHSKVWKESAIFGVEDDTQNGVDHVDGHRGPAFVISPYSKGGVDDEYATQPNMVRTVEQILGIQPMNQEDYAAEPMYGAFTERPNFAPYTALPNEIPLTLGVKGSLDGGAHDEPGDPAVEARCPPRCRASTRPG